MIHLKKVAIRDEETRPAVDGTVCHVVGPPVGGAFRKQAIKTSNRLKRAVGSLHAEHSSVVAGAADEPTGAALI